jgi:hypothetical protein
VLGLGDLDRNRSGPQDLAAACSDKSVFQLGPWDFDRNRSSPQDLVVACNDN